MDLEGAKGELDRPRLPGLPATGYTQCFLLTSVVAVHGLAIATLGNVPPTDVGPALGHGVEDRVHARGSSRRSIPLWSSIGVAIGSSSMSSSEMSIDEKIMLTPPGNGYLT